MTKKRTRASATGGTPSKKKSPPKPKSPLDAAVAQATAGMPKARGRPPKKASVEQETSHLNSPEPERGLVAGSTR